MHTSIPLLDHFPAEQLGMRSRNELDDRDLLVVDAARASDVDRFAPLMHALPRCCNGLSDAVYHLQHLLLVR
jgi:hypothetical protein